jgi:biotin synthase
LQPVPVHTVIRTIATARIVMPKTIIRLAAGRHTFTETEQMMAFMAGANAIFTGEKMLTTPCSGWDDDKAMLSRWGLRGLRSFEDAEGNKVDEKFVQVQGDEAVLTSEAMKHIEAQ